MTASCREMTMDDYAPALELWRATEGMGLSDADSEVAIALFLKRNPGLSFVCVEDGQLIGTMLCGHDGRRGFIYHGAVHRDHRGKGIARQLMNLCVDGLRKQGIAKCHLFVVEDNESGSRFWEHAGWFRRDNILFYSRNLPAAVEE